MNKEIKILQQFTARKGIDMQIIFTREPVSKLVWAASHIHRESNSFI
jgi:hypothetical protein